MTLPFQTIVPDSRGVHSHRVQRILGVGKPTPGTDASLWEVESAACPGTLSRFCGDLSQPRVIEQGRNMYHEMVRDGKGEAGLLVTGGMSMFLFP